MSVVDGRVALVCLGVLVLAGCGGQAAPGAGTVRAADNPALGRILVDTGGRTLYFADQEADGTGKCTADCLDFWSPAVSPDGSPSGVDGLAVLKRSDNGTSQLTYRGKPLYTFQLDKNAGDTKGNGVADEFGGTRFVWHAVTLGGQTQAPPQPGGY